MGEKKRVSNAAGKKKANQNTAKNGRRPSSGRKRRRGMTANQFILIMAVVVGIILVFTVSKIMQNRYMKVTKIGSEYALGTPFDIKNYVQPVNDKATVECDEADFQPDKVGPYKVKYTVRCGRLKKHNIVTIEVVDHDFPDITGPEKIGVLKGEMVDLLKYYNVNDSVRVMDGPLKDFIGTVTEINKEKHKVKVMVSMFGRETPVELEFSQVQKV